MAAYEGPNFDAENHFYEAHDAFTRHVPEKMQSRCVQWITLERNARQYQLVGGRLDPDMTNANPTFDPISKPGVLRELFRGNPEGKTGRELMRSSLEPLRPEDMDPEARLAVMDEQGLDGAWLFPTQAVLLEEQIKHDVTASCVMFDAFNRWLAEFCAELPGRRAGVGIVPPHDIDLIIDVVGDHLLFINITGYEVRNGQHASRDQGVGIHARLYRSFSHSGVRRASKCARICAGVAPMVSGCRASRRNRHASSSRPRRMSAGIREVDPVSQ